MLKQLSIFTENTKGALLRLIRILSEKNINVLASVTNDSAEFGTIRMIVNAPKQAAELLQAHQYLCKLKHVVAVRIEDRPGSLRSLLKAIDDSYINVNYLYDYFDRSDGSPIIILGTDDMEEVESCLAARGFQVLDTLC